MLKTLKIENYKSHKKTRLEFVPGVNCIVGDPQSGKTNILRALIWAITNRPSGAKFFSNFAGEKGTTKVALELDSGEKISLTKNIKYNKENEKVVEGATYELDGKKFQGFGTNVPDLIEGALNLSDLNVQKQLDVPFLVTSSPGEVARTINKITKLEKVDEWTSDLTKRINKSNQHITLLEKEKTDIKAKLTTYNDIDETEKLVKKLTEVDTRLEKNKKTHHEINEIVLEIEDLENEIEFLEELLSTEKYIKRASRIEEKIVLLIKQREDTLKVYNVKQDISDMRSLQETLTKLIKFEEKRQEAQELKTELMDLQRRSELIIFLEDLYEICSKIYILDDISLDLEEVEGLQSDIIKLEATQKKLKEEYITILKEEKKCPTCYGPITEKCIERIKKKL